MTLRAGSVGCGRIGSEFAGINPPTRAGALGLKPKYLDMVIVRKARVDIKADEPVTRDKI